MPMCMGLKFTFACKTNVEDAVNAVGPPHDGSLLKRSHGELSAEGGLGVCLLS